MAKSDREDLPKALVQLGAVGGVPVTAQMLSYRAGGYVDVLMGEKDSHETLYRKEHPILKLQVGKTLSDFDLTGSLFNGISDAFYRGKLPEVLLVAPSVSGLEAFLEELLEHLDKLGSLGFFLSNPSLPQSDSAHRLLPILVLASNGIFYTGFCKKLAERLVHMSALSPQIRQQLEERVLRGVFSYDEAFGASLGNVVNCEAPALLNLAGGGVSAQNTVRNLLSVRGFQVRIAETGSLPAERLEVEQALYRLHFCVLPALNQLGELSLEEMKEDQALVERQLLEIGKKRKLFEAKETAAGILAGYETKGKNIDPSLISGDSTSFRYLLRYVDPAQEIERQRFEVLKQKVLHQLEVKRKSEK